MGQTDGSSHDPWLADYIGLMTRCWPFWPTSDYAGMNSRQGASRQGGTSQLGVIRNSG
jgi:hypothetical protein